MSRTKSSENLPSSMERNLEATLRIARHGHHTSAMWMLLSWMKLLLETYLSCQEQGLGVPELIDRVKSDGNRYEGKAQLMEELRLFDARVTSALNEQGPGAWERANAALTPHVEESVDLIRRVLPCLFDFSKLKEASYAAEEGGKGLKQVPPG